MNFLLLLFQFLKKASEDINDRKTLLKFILLNQAQTFGNIPRRKYVIYLVVDLLNSTSNFLDFAF